MNTSLQVGGALVLAIVSAVVTSHGGAGASSAELIDGFRSAVAVVTGIALVSLLVALTGVVGREPALEPADA